MSRLTLGRLRAEATVTPRSAQRTRARRRARFRQRPFLMSRPGLSWRLRPRWPEPPGLTIGSPTFPLATEAT
eukprot:4134598-Lingulodinium_polyedra.AAC.1